jgi:hypothetical protein
MSVKTKKLVMPPEKWVVVHDIHHPKVDWPTFKAIAKFTKDFQPHGLILGGDQLDNEELSHHNKGKYIYKPRGAYDANLTSFDKDILTVIEKALPAGAKKVWIDGNHERFAFDYVEEHPELEGTIDHVKRLKLVERGWEIVPLGHSKRLGHLDVIHGEVLSGIGNQAGIYPSRKALDIYDGSVLAGHTHSPQSFAKISPVDNRKKRMAWINMIVGGLNPTYLRNRPTSWVNGFSVVLLRSNGDFNVFPIVVTDCTFSYGDKTYSV